MTGPARDRILVHAVGERWRWLALDRQGRVRRQGECSPEQPDWPGQGRLCVLVDAADCVALSVELPELGPTRLAQALRWAAEEHLSSGAEDEHVVAGPRSADGRQHCLVIADARMQALQECLSGQELEIILPDALCLPWQSGQIVMGRLGERILVRWGEWSFGSFEPALLDAVIDGLDDGQAERVWLGGAAPPTPTLVNEAPADDLLPQLASQALAAPVNLLSGQWAPSSAHSARAWWRWAAGLAAGLAALLLVFAAVENHLLKRQADSLQQAIDSQFRQAFPDVARVVRHREQAERELARLRFGESAGLLDLMNRTAPVIDGQTGLRLEGLNYREGLLELSVRGPDVAALDQFEQRLRALDLNARVQSASMDGEGASGRLHVSGVAR